MYKIIFLLLCVTFAYGINSQQKGQELLAAQYSYQAKKKSYDEAKLEYDTERERYLFLQKKLQQSTDRLKYKKHVYEEQSKHFMNATVVLRKAWNATH